MQVHIHYVFRGQEIPLMNGGYHGLDGFHYELLHSHKAVQGLEIQNWMNLSFILWNSKQVGVKSLKPFQSWNRSNHPLEQQILHHPGESLQTRRGEMKIGIK